MRTKLYLRLAAGLALATSLALVGCSSTTSSPGASASAQSSDQAALQAELTPLTVRPTSIGITDPITGGVKPGKTIAYMQCSLTDCVSIGDSLREAAALVGWTVDTINSGLSPETVQAAWTEALRVNPDAIIQSGSPEASIYKDQLAEAQARNIPLLGIAESIEGNPFLLSTGSFTGYVSQMMKLEAKWIASKISDGSVYVPNIPGIGIVQNEITAFSDQLKISCPACTIDSFDVPATSLGTDSGQVIANYIQGHPGGKFLFLPAADLSIGLASALSGVGMADGIPTVTGSQTPAMLPVLQAGTGGLQMTVSLPSVEGAYRWVDALARHFNNQSVDVDKDSTLPFWIVTPGNVPDTRPLPQVADYKQQFAALWGVSA